MVLKYDTLLSWRGLALLGQFSKINSSRELPTTLDPLDHSFCCFLWSCHQWYGEPYHAHIQWLLSPLSIRMRTDMNLSVLWVVSTRSQTDKIFVVFGGSGVCVGMCMCVCVCVLHGRRKKSKCTLYQMIPYIN